MSPTDQDEQDLTRKERREQARTERRAAEEAHAASTARRRRLTQLGAVAGVVVVAIVVILVATGGGGKSTGPTREKSKQQNTNSAAIQQLIGGIPQKGIVLGADSAPVTLVYFGDLECPVCKDFTDGALKTLIEKWVRPGKLRIEYRSLETATREPEVFRTQQVAALAAGKQNKMWDYTELFYKEQGEEGSGYVTEEYLHKLATGVPGLDIGQWSSARSDTALSNELEEDAQAANQQGFSGTPSFLVGHTGGASKKFEPRSLTDAGDFNSAIEKLT